MTSDCAPPQVRATLSLAFNSPPWRAPLETARHWRTLAPGRKCVVFHPSDRIIGRAGLVYADCDRLQLIATDCD